jgi:hypothetical protein
MTDIEICQRDNPILLSTPRIGRPEGSIDRVQASGMQGNTAMTVEILNLTAQIQRWLNARVADYLAAQAERLPH